MKLYTSTTKMACPSPHPAPRAASTVTQSHFARMPPPSVDRQRRRHRDGALVRERIGVRPEAEVERHRPEPRSPAPSELEPLALVARHPAPQDEDPDPLLPADVHGSTPPAVQHV